MGLRMHQYLGSTHPGILPRNLLQQMCALLTDQTLPGAPRLWNFFAEPFCGMYVVPFGTAGDEVQFFGTCNRSVSAFAVAPPPPLFGTACLPPRVGTAR